MIRLRKLRTDDADGMLEWMNDPEAQKNFQAAMNGRSRQEVLAFISGAAVWPEEGKSIHYAIADDEDTYLGTISLKNINLRDKNAEYAISLRRNAQGKGVAFEATKELLRLAFEVFGLERIYLNVLTDNDRAIQLYEKSGFSFEGEFKKHLYLRQEYKNLRWYAMLEKEYREIFRGGG